MTEFQSVILRSWLSSRDLYRALPIYLSATISRTLIYPTEPIVIPCPPQLFILEAALAEQDVHDT